MEILQVKNFTDSRIQTQYSTLWDLATAAKANVSITSNKT